MAGIELGTSFNPLTLTLALKVDTVSTPEMRENSSELLYDRVCPSVCPFVFSLSFYPRLALNYTGQVGLNLTAVLLPERWVYGRKLQTSIPVTNHFSKVLPFQCSRNSPGVRSHLRSLLPAPSLQYTCLTFVFTESRNESA